MLKVSILILDLSKKALRCQSAPSDMTCIDLQCGISIIMSVDVNLRMLS
jgi:hypothetical protein